MIDDSDGGYHTDSQRIPTPEELDALWKSRRDYGALYEITLKRMLLLGCVLLVWILIGAVIAALVNGDIG